mmetsp:Transcript_18907/g.40727  ORF Transcript_18907/g.40727 Transcript_18907/m.40727 type:complete len:210 (+) Transcript_18907:470-1099(+)
MLLVMQVVMVDGCGVLHPAGFGSACHLGVVAGVPTIGVAKNLLWVEGLQWPESQKRLHAVKQAAAAATARPEGSDSVAAAEEGVASSDQERAAGTGQGPEQSSSSSQAATSHDFQCCAAASGVSPSYFEAQDPEGGRCSPLLSVDGSTVLGAALQPPGVKKPLYISVGHRVGLPTAVELVRQCCRYRVPEPTRQADIRSREYIRKQKQQ